MIAAMCERNVADLFNSFNPMLPLRAADEHLYVDWQRQLGVDDVKRHLTQAIAYGEGPGNTYFLTGHRGVGKTTELFRVKRHLETGVAGRRLFVSMLSAERWLDLTDVEPEDLVFQIVRQLVGDLSGAGFELGVNRFVEWFRRMRDILRRKIDLETIQIGTNPLKFTFKAEDLIGARSEFREVLRGQLPTLYDLVNDEVLNQARPWLAARENGGFSGILIIVDQTDRIPENRLNGQTNHERIFINRAGALQALGCDVLYTLPIELAYSPVGQGQLPDIYGTPIRKLPVVPVTDRHGNPRPLARNALVQIVERRVAAVGLSLEDVFTTSDLLDDVVMSSGGHVRNLFVLLRSMFAWIEDLPIDRDIVDQSLQKAAAELDLPLNSEDWKLLNEVHRTKQPMNENAAWYPLLRDQYILVYQEQGGYWYDSNPLLGHLAGWARR